MSEAVTTVDREAPEQDAQAEAAPAAARSWIERLWSSIADRGRLFASVPSDSIPPLDRAKSLVEALLTERGPDRRRRICLTSWHLQLDVGLNFLGHACPSYGRRGTAMAGLPHPM